jgi:hypothetical protein
MRPGFDSRKVKHIFFYSTESRPSLGPTQPPIQWVLGALSPGVMWPGRDDEHLPATSSEVKNRWIYTPTPTYVFLASCLIN